MKGPSGKGSGYAEFSSTSSTQLPGGLGACLLTWCRRSHLYHFAILSLFELLGFSSLAPHSAPTTTCTSTNHHISSIDTVPC